MDAEDTECYEFSEVSLLKLEYKVGYQVVLCLIFAIPFFFTGRAFCHINQLGKTIIKIGNGIAK